jgi:hypothetical protein
MALGAMMREGISNLTKRYVHLHNNAIDDAGLQAFIPGICNNNNLEKLLISDQITAAGLRLYRFSCNLTYEIWRRRSSSISWCIDRQQIIANTEFSKYGKPKHHSNGLVRILQASVRYF